MKTIPIIQTSGPPYGAWLLLNPLGLLAACSKWLDEAHHPFAAAYIDGASLRAQAALANRP